MSHHLIIGLALTAATVFLLGLFVLLRREKGPIGIIFFSIVFYFLVEFFQLVMISTSNPQDTLFWGKILHAGNVFIPAFLIHFIGILLNSPPTYWNRISLYGMSSIFSVLALSTDLVISGTSNKTGVPIATSGPLYLVVLSFFGSCTLYGHTKLYHAYITAVPAEKERLAIYSGALLAGT